MFLLIKPHIASPATHMFGLQLLSLCSNSYDIRRNLLRIDLGGLSRRLIAWGMHVHFVVGFGTQSFALRAVQSTHRIEGATPDSLTVDGSNSAPMKIPKMSRKSPKYNPTYTAPFKEVRLQFIHRQYVMDKMYFIHRITNLSLVGAAERQVWDFKAFFFNRD